DRQEQVLRLIERGMTNGQIATELGITLDGVKFHVSEILSKLEVGSREEAVAVWRSSRAPRGLSILSAPLLRWTVVGAAGGAGLILVVAVIAMLRGGESPERAEPGATATITLTADPTLT